MDIVEFNTAFMKLIKTQSILFLIGLVSIMFGIRANAQELSLTDAPVIAVNFGFSSQFPIGELSERFGRNTNLGLGVDYISEKTNWIFGLEGHFLFGGNVKENVISGLRTVDGALIGNDRNFADIQLGQRGFYIGGLVGKLFSLSDFNKRSGIRFTIGTGLLQHKIRIQRDPEREVPQITGDYAKGYDRLTNGLAFNEFLGYQLLSKNRRLNFYFGAEFTQAFTRSRRTFDFDRMAADTEDRLDLLIGVRLGIVLPFYISNSDQIYY